MHVESIQGLQIRRLMVSQHMWISYFRLMLACLRKWASSIKSSRRSLGAALTHIVRLQSRCSTYGLIQRFWNKLFSSLKSRISLLSFVFFVTFTLVFAANSTYSFTGPALHVVGYTFDFHKWILFIVYKAI